MQIEDSVKLRALVGMSKMCASSGGDVTRNIIADGAGQRIFKQIRQLLLKNPTEEARKWVIEALAYLTIDAEVRDEGVSVLVQINLLNLIYIIYRELERFISNQNIT